MIVRGIVQLNLYKCVPSKRKSGENVSRPADEFFCQGQRLISHEKTAYLTIASISPN